MIRIGISLLFGNSKNFQDESSIIYDLLMLISLHMTELMVDIKATSFQLLFNKFVISIFIKDISLPEIVKLYYLDYYQQRNRMECKLI